MFLLACADFLLPHRGDNLRCESRDDSQKCAAMSADLDANRWMDHVLKHMQSRNNSVHFIQVGACDGDWKSSNDPLQKMMMTEPNFQGMMIEPVFAEFEKLQAVIQGAVNRTDRIQAVNMAISPDQDGKLPFYMVDGSKVAEDFPNAPHWLKHQLGSFNESLIKKSLVDFGQLKEKGWKHYVRELTVEALKPSSLMERYWASKSDAVADQKINILMIDAEGFDGKIVKAFMDLPTMRPNIIVFERKHLAQEEAQECVEMLRGMGYRVDNVKANVVAVKIQMNMVM